MNTELKQVVDGAGRVILGKERELTLALSCLLARGHLLIEDLPGLGKTTLAHTLAQLLGLDYSRIQFTSDLLPADILGVSVYDREDGRFHFHPGPVFARLVLADEINRATPKAQSALLEAMEERQVTIEGETRPLPEPFFVIATQNPAHQIGTFPLPESQVDRFLMRIRLGYPDREAERTLLRGADRRSLLPHLQPVLEPRQLVELQRQAAGVHVSEALLDYCQGILGHTRDSPRFRHGLSPRAGLALLRGARAWAFIQGRSMVLPEDVQAVLPAVVGHRLAAAADAGGDPDTLAHEVLRAVPVP
jgi:MoxR-like ATPase